MGAERQYTPRKSRRDDKRAHQAGDHPPSASTERSSVEGDASVAHTMGMSMLGVRSWRSALASAMVGALLVALPVTASAQDIPYGKTPTKSAPKQAPKAQVPKAPAVKAPAVKAPAAEVPKAPEPAVDPDDARERMKAQPFPGDAKAPTTKAAKDAKEPTLSAPDLEALKSALAPFGTWIEHPERGTMWIPSTKEVGKSFAPYKSSGRWGLDKSGDWTWISDYPWGDIPFHFGNWQWLPPAEQPAQGNAPPAEHGWAWVPGAQYAPAWVVWRLGDAKNPFVGWAPAPPSKKLVNGKLVPLTKEQVLPFFYVPADRLFEGGVARHVVTDRKVGRSAHDATKIFAGNLCAPGKTPLPGQGDKAKQQCQGASLWQPASPTLKQAGIAAALIAEPPAAPRSLNDAVRALAPATKKPATQSKLDNSATTDEAPTTERGKNFVRRCVRTKRHGMRCWTYRWPPLWRGRR